MDILILIIISIYGFLGFRKGAVRMLFSLLRVTILFFLSYYLSEALENALQGSSLYLGVVDFVEGIFNNLVPGEFASVEEALASVGLLANTVLRTVLQIVLKSVTIEGSLTFGEIIAPMLASVVIRVLLFIVIFFLLSLIFKLIDFALKKSLDFSGLTKINRVLGLILGLLKGFVISMIIFVVFSALASLSFSDAFSAFVQGGELSSYLYQTYFLKIFQLFY